MSTRTGMMAFQTPNCYPPYQTNSAVPFKRRRLDDVAESHPTGLVGAELHVGDLLGRDEHPAALLRVQREDALALFRGEGGGQVALDLLGRRFGLVHELARH